MHCIPACIACMHAYRQTNRQTDIMHEQYVIMNIMHNSMALCMHVIHWHTVHVIHMPMNYKNSVWGFHIVLCSVGEEEAGMI